MISLIIAFQATHYGYLVGDGDHLPWKCKPDMKWFVKNTKGKHLLMGSKTFEGMIKSWPVDREFLAGRTVTVFSRHSNLFDLLYGNHKNVDFYDCLEKWVTRHTLGCFDKNTEYVVCGGPTIYKTAMDLNCVSKLYLTEIEREHYNEPKNPIYLDDVIGDKFSSLTRSMDVETVVDEETKVIANMLEVAF